MALPVTARVHIIVLSRFILFLNTILREGHRRMSKLPPIRALNQEDAAFCREVLGENKMETDEEIEDTVHDTDVTDGDDDDNSSWESIASDDDLNVTKTELIYRYFEGRTYKMIRMEEPAFAAFYSEE